MTLALERILGDASGGIYASAGDGTYYGVPSWDAFTSAFGADAAGGVQMISSDQFSGQRQGAWSDSPFVTFERAVGDYKVYAVKNGVRYWVPDPETFMSVFGMDPSSSRIVSVSPDLVAAQPERPWSQFAFTLPASSSLANGPTTPLRPPTLPSVMPLAITPTPAPNGPGSTTGVNTPLGKASTSQLLFAALVVALFFL